VCKFGNHVGAFGGVIPKLKYAAQGISDGSVLLELAEKADRDTDLGGGECTLNWVRYGKIDGSGSSQ
jgi:hypothetical protein